MIAPFVSELFAYLSGQAVEDILREMILLR